MKQSAIQNIKTYQHLARERGFVMDDPIKDCRDWRVEATKENETRICIRPDLFRALQGCLDML